MEAGNIHKSSESFYHNPYKKKVLETRGDGSCGAAADFFSAALYLAESQSSCTFEKELEPMDTSERMTHTECDYGISDNGTEETGCALSALSSFPTLNMMLQQQQQQTTTATTTTTTSPPLLRFASVNFRFGSAWFLAPFRTAIGEMVVVEYPHNNSLHIGLVSCISTHIPHTFAALISPNKNITEENIRLFPRLLRHARDFDRQTKMELRSQDLISLRSAQELALEMQAPVTFLDAEWLLDLTAVTFFVNVWGDMSLVDRLADELAALEGAEVVFTYPATV